MTPVGLIGLLLSFAAFPIASQRMSANRVLVFFTLLLLHVGAAVVYYLYTQTASADTTLYYYDSVGMVRWPFALGTVFTVRLVQFLKGAIGGSYLDYFLIFQAFGFWGIVLLMRSFEEIHALLGTAQGQLANALLFLPGMHFWSSAVGKDAPLFLAVSLAVWSMLSLRRRWIPMAIALGIMVLFRPHIALVTVMSVALAALLGGRQSILTRVGLLTVALAGAALIATTVESTFQVQVSNPDSVSDFFVRRNAVFSTLEGGTAVRDASYPFKLFSLMFRPFFIDANGVFALIASFENAILLVMIAFMAWNWRESLRLVRSVYFLKFVLVFACLLTALLASVYYNVGLGLRQKIMIMPAFLCFFVAQWAYHQRMRTVPLAPAEATA